MNRQSRRTLCAAGLITAVLAIRSFLSFIKRRDFTLFGWYRIALAIAFYLFAR